MSSIKKYGAMLCMTGVLVVFTGNIRAFPGIQEKQGISINEICSWNESIQKDGSRKYSDYIELYNHSDEEISLEGWYLSDDKGVPRKAELGDIRIGPGEFYVFYANGDPEDENSLPFRISSRGENIFLSDPTGRLVDSVEVPELKADTVYARREDGTGSWQRMAPSPEAGNEGCEWLREPVLDVPVFSADGGFYSEPFYLEIEAGSGEHIYYTLDGSEPTEASEEYTGSIYIENVSDRPNVYNSIQNVVADWKEYTPSPEPVDKAVVVRAVAMDDNFQISEVVTETYFIGLASYHEMDVISIVADSKELFGDQGIYVTGREYDDWYLNGGEGEAPPPEFMKDGRNREIECSIEFWESGIQKVQQKAGLRIQGASSRKFVKKRFSVYARREYNGDVYFEDGIFEDKKIHSFTLRDGFANAAVPELLEGRSVAVQSARRNPVSVFLNGEYWYTTYIQEKVNSYLLGERYGVDRDNIFIIKDLEVKEGDRSDVNTCLELLDYFDRNDFSALESYEEVCRIIDTQSFIDFMCVNVYLCNMDVADWHNHILWRSYENKGTEYEDGRWRWILYDLDYVGWVDLEYFGISNHVELNAFSTPMQYSGQKRLDEMTIFAALRYNEEFKKQFVLTYMDMANTIFSPEYVETVFEKWGEDLHWHDDFFLKRFEYAVPDLAEEFSLQGTLAELVLEQEDTEGGYIILNTCEPDLSDGSWSGKYYTDYPVSLTAVAYEGYRFMGWQGDVQAEAESMSLELEEGTTKIRAVFEKTEN